MMWPLREEIDMRKLGRVTPIKNPFFFAMILALLTVASLTAGCESKLTTIALTAAKRIPKGTSAQLQAVGTYSDGSQRDLTELLTWASDNPAVLTVADAAGHKGLVTALDFGSATITGSYGEQSATTQLTAAAAVVTAIAITPPNPVIARGTTVQLTATGTMSDGTTQDATALASWSSLSPAVADFPAPNGSKALAAGVAAGTAVLVANVSGVSARISLTVNDASLLSLTLTPVHPILAKGTTQQLVATGTFSDKSTQDVSSLVSWTSSDFNVATVASAGVPGLGTAVATGTVNVTATLRGVSGATALTVTDATLVAIGVTPHSATLAKGTTQQFSATGTYSDGTTQDLTSSVVWTAANNTAVSISNDIGYAGLGAALSKGTCTIMATLEGKTGSASLVIADADLVAITLTSSSATIAQGTTQQFVATGVYSDGSSQDLSSNVTWSSSDSTVAAVSNADGSRGLLSGITRGVVTVAAAFGQISGSMAFAISDATLNAITITPARMTLAAGTTGELVATGQYSDGTTQDLTAAVSWSAEDQAVAQISSAAGSAGLVTGLNKGTTAVSATLAGVTATATLAITDSTLVTIVITPRSARLKRGTTQQFVATGSFSDGTTQDLTSAVTWSSSDNTVASISNAADSEGLALGEAPGPTIIVASLNGVTKSTTLTVN